MKYFRRILAGAALMVAVSGLASADSITSNYLFPPTVNCSPGTLSNPGATNPCTNLQNTPVSNTQAVSQFNPAWGTLTDVVIQVEDYGIYTITLTNGSSGVASYTLTNPGVASTLCIVTSTCAPVGKNELLNDTPNSIDSTTFANMTAGQVIGPVVYVDNIGDMFDAQNDSSSGNVANLSGGLAYYLNYFSGNGTSNLYEAASQDTSIAGAGKTVTDASSAGFYVSVTYDYTIPSGTPEPTTMTLMGGALLGLGLLGKRLKRS